MGRDVYYERGRKPKDCGRVCVTGCVCLLLVREKERESESARARACVCVSECAADGATKAVCSLKNNFPSLSGIHTLCVFENGYFRIIM